MYKRYQLGVPPTLNLVSEKETGTIEAMNVIPVGRFTFVLSKLIPYWAVGLIVITVGMIIGWLVYGLVPVGNIAESIFIQIASMPEWAQYFTYSVSPRCFVEIMRSVYLKGASIADLWSQYVTLLCFVLLFCTIAAITYKNKKRT